MTQKRLFILIICCSLIAAVSSAFSDTASVRVGELTWLQQDSDERSASLKSMRSALSMVLSDSGETAESDTLNLYSCDQEIVYFDDINSMLMALESGRIDAAELYTSVCRYISNVGNNHLEVFGGNSFNETNPQAENRVLALNLMDALFSVDFSFMFLENQEALRDLFNEALREMAADGTQERLIREQVADVIYNPEKELISAESTPIEGAETIRVGVTGALPPIDYFTEAGKPAGYSTQVMAEIGRRIGKNIEFVSVDSGARAMALSAGSVDVIFWARNHVVHDTYVIPQAWKIMLRDQPDLSNELSPEDEAMIRNVRDTVRSIRISENEQLDGTIFSDPFYTDWYAYLVRKE